MDLLREKFRLVSRLSHPNIATALVLHPCRDINIRDDAVRVATQRPVGARMRRAAEPDLQFVIFSQTSCNRG